jgi:pantetheine-phosphate adenylyltransferase
VCGPGVPGLVRSVCVGAGQLQGCTGEFVAQTRSRIGLKWAAWQHDRVIAAYPGSFDPLHLGHMSVIDRASTDFDEVVVVVLANPAKLHLLSIAQRVELVVASTAHLGNVRAIGYDGLTVDGARATGADALIRNAGKELQLERAMSVTNERLSGLPTVLMPPEPTTGAISSTSVRALLAQRRYDDIESLVPQPVHLALRNL